MPWAFLTGGSRKLKALLTCNPIHTDPVLLKQRHLAEVGDSTLAAARALRQGRPLVPE